MREYGSEYPAIILPDGYFESLRELGREISYLRSGREALWLQLLVEKVERKLQSSFFLPTAAGR